MMILDNSIDTIVLQDDFRVQFRWIVFACLSLCCVEYRQVTGPNPAEEMRICAAGAVFGMTQSRHIGARNRVST